VDSKYESSWGGRCSSEPIGAYKEGVGESFVVIPNLRWVMAPRLESSVIFGVGI
jgi:hypothetical protein